MALGDTSPFAPVDMLGGLVTNVLATNMACKNHSFRTGITVKTGQKDANGQDVKEVPPYLDYRFLGGLALALGGQVVDNPMIRRASNDVANGLLNSFVATETCRRQALQRVSAEEWASPTGWRPWPDSNPNQIGADEMPQSAPSGAHAQNYSYGW